MFRATFGNAHFRKYSWKLGILCSPCLPNAIKCMHGSSLVWVLLFNFWDLELALLSFAISSILEFPCEEIHTSMRHFFVLQNIDSGEVIPIGNYDYLTHGYVCKYLYHDLYLEQCRANRCLPVITSIWSIFGVWLWVKFKLLDLCIELGYPCSFLDLVAKYCSCSLLALIYHAINWQSIWSYWHD